MSVERVQRFLTEVLTERRAEFRRNPAQLDYLASVEAALDDGQGRIHFIEGDTGIGKSIAYLLALADWIARGPRGEGRRRAVVATHTRALQRQLLEPGNRAIVAEYLEWAGLAQLTLGLRVGRSNYVSPERLALALNAESLDAVATDSHRHAIERRLAEWALTTDGCLLEIGEAHLPDGVTFEDICLLPGEPLPDSLEAVFECSRQCDIMVLNHALLVHDLISGGQISGAREGHALLLDEAEHYARTAERALSHRLSATAVGRLLREMGMKAAQSAWGAIQEVLKRHARPGSVEPLGEHEIAVVLEQLRDLLRSRPHQDRHDASSWAEWQRVREAAQRIAQRLEAESQTVLVECSPVLGYPSLVYEEPEGGASLKAGHDRRTTLLTSATLSDMDGPNPQFIYLRQRLSLGWWTGSDSRVGLERSHQALDFGRLTFCLPAGLPRPLVHDAERRRYRLAPDYVRAVLPYLLAAEGQRTLVLCASYADVESLLAAWPQEERRRLFAHLPGQSLTQIAESLPKDGVLVSPAAWEGLSPARTEGEPFWGHLVILRNPTPAPSPVTELALIHHLQRLAPRAVAERVARRELRNRAYVETLHKLRQGIGRALRHPEDVCRLTLLDPRFPRPSGARTPGVKVNPVLVDAIPRRFLGAYHSGDEGAGQDAQTSASGLVL